MSGRILIVAGEASGDRLGAGLAEALRSRDEDLRLEGMGGDRMRRAGVELHVDASRLGVTGFVEVLRRLGEVRAALKTLKDRLREDPPDVLVPIDYPDFNLRLARAASRRGVPVVYFVSPQVWAWRRGRVRGIARHVERMLVLFSFEEDFYKAHGVEAVFVGHPMVERLAEVPPKAEARRNLGLPPHDPVVGLLPGSRENEIERILPIMRDAATRIADRVRNLRFVLPEAPRVEQGIYDRILASGPPVMRFPRDYEALVRASDVVAVASGTATMETALLGTPLVAVYRLHPVTYWIGRLLVRVEHVAMPNLIAGERLVPELVQKDLTPQRLASELERLLHDADARARMEAGLREVRRAMAGPRPFERAADEILGVLQSSSASEDRSSSQSRSR